MKKATKFLTMFTLIAVIAFTACGGTSVIAPEKLKLDKAYKFSAAIEFSEFAVKGEFERKSPNVWEVVMTEPFALEGVVLTYDNGEISATLDNIQTTLSGELSVVNYIISAFENAVSGEGREIISANENIIVSSRAGTPALAYELIFAKKSLEPKSLTIPARALNVTFSEVQTSQIVHVVLNN